MAKSEKTVLSENSLQIGLLRPWVKELSLISVGVLVAVVIIITFLVLVSLIFAGFWIRNGSIVHDNPGFILYSMARTLNKLGPVSDFVGGILNPLVALSALVGLIYSVRIQRDTLRVTRDGISYQLDQENFFVLLGNRESAIASLELARGTANQKNSTEPFLGRSALREILGYIEHRSSQIMVATRNDIDLNARDFSGIIRHFEVPNSRFLAQKDKIIIGLFALLYTGASETRVWSDLGLQVKVDNEMKRFKASFRLQSIEELLGHIFRSTYQVLKFVYYSGFINSKKIDLINYLRAQMSEADFAAYALTALTSIGDKSRGLAIAFDLYERRLLSTPWARPLAECFNPVYQENMTVAHALKYERIANNN